MDYGQPIKTDEPTNFDGGQPFFTTGAGNNYGDSFESGENDINNDQDIWNQEPQESEHNHQEIGNAAIRSVEKPEAYRKNIKNTPNGLGEIINLEMPPNHQEETVVSQPEQPNITLPTEAEIKTSETLNRAGLKAVQDSINTFHKDGNPASFYDAVRGENGEVYKNLKNSFGRNINGGGA